MKPKSNISIEQKASNWAINHALGHFKVKYLFCYISQSNGLIAMTININPSIER